MRQEPDAELGADGRPCVQSMARGPNNGVRGPVAGPRGPPQRVVMGIQTTLTGMLARLGQKRELLVVTWGGQQGPQTPL